MRLLAVTLGFLLQAWIVSCGVRGKTVHRRIWGAVTRMFVFHYLSLNYYLLVSMTPIYFADKTQLRFRSDDRNRSQCRKRLPNANGSCHRYIEYTLIYTEYVLFLADIEAVRNGQWPETRQLKVSTREARELPFTSSKKEILFYKEKMILSKY
ncbi:hypothetical protein ALC57_15519 [Trachymyrmex cornetzi]|uniref:Uncharacterized protein n=1 Tax=Trachymyrmex cornetzi TaxID=471704 RepID=A0A151IWU6_9HYME|nr:hypothetical protein ALC57_15519 [Trachymyrmex cornetzi]